MQRKIFLILSLCIFLVTCIFDSTNQNIVPVDYTTQIKPRVADPESPYIKVGLYASLTGSASLLGQMGQMGIRLAVEELNTSGGINGKQILLVEYDDQTNPDRAVSIVTKMIQEDHVDAIIGSHTSGNIVCTAPLTEQAETLQIGLGTSYVWTNAGYKYLFRAAGNSKHYDDAIFTAIQERGFKKIALYYCSTDYAEAGAKALIERIQTEPSMNLVWVRSHDITQTDFKSDLFSLKASSAEAVILYATSENAGIQLRQLREEVGYRGVVYSPEAFASTAARLEAGASANGLIYACTNTIPNSPQDALSPQEKDFLEKFIKMYGTMPTAETAYRGYDAMMLLAEVFRSAKSFQNDDLLQAMLSITNYTGICGNYDFSDGSGDGIQGCKIIFLSGPSTIERVQYYKCCSCSGY